VEALSLDGKWEFRRVGDKKWYPAVVPGCNFTDLLTNKRIPDPFVEDNELKMQWVIDSDWEYRREFLLNDAFLAHDAVLLECEGLDTLATIEINGRKVGTSDNMFMPHVFDVKKALNEGGNEILVRFASAVRSAQADKRLKNVQCMGCSIEGSPIVRKAQCQFGWDWGPQLPQAGIWRSIVLAGRDLARLDDVHLRQAHGGQNVTLSADVTLKRWGGGTLRVRMTVEHPDGDEETKEALVLAPRTGASVSMQVKNPQIWWPNGFGDQPLYTVRVVLMSEHETVLDEQVRRVGLRKVELKRRKDKFGESFEFVVNGVPIFAKGANWIPADSFPNRVDRDDYRYLLESAVEAHMNMLRVWGGGFYENEEFYDLCDELGLLVWQDFMFACNVYPYDKKFHENVEREAAAAVRRLRHRACVALWCGNNEMEEGWVHWGWDDRFPKPVKDGYRRLFHKILPKVVAKEDPDRSYWPSSPYSGKPFYKPRAEEWGDSHTWEVWHRMKPFMHYRTSCSRFMSEFGFQSFPCIETVESYAEKKDWNVTSHVMEHHQRHWAGNGKIVQYMLDTFRLPRSFDDFCYVSQVLQAEAIRYGVEHWRRHCDRARGTLYWQLNDCWPVASWSSIDYYGRWKALHYAAKRFYAPILLSAEETRCKADLHVTNDTTRAFKGAVRWTLETLDGEILREKQAKMMARSGADTTAASLDFSNDITDDNRRHVVLVYELMDAKGEWVSGGVVPFVPSKHLELVNPGLTWQAFDMGTHWAVTLRAQSLARFVEIKLKDMDSLWSDNYFDIPAGRQRTVTCHKIEGITLSRIKADLRIRSLWNSF